jgi:hypothetical protein
MACHPGNGDIPDWMRNRNMKSVTSTNYWRWYSSRKAVNIVICKSFPSTYDAVLPSPDHAILDVTDSLRTDTSFSVLAEQQARGKSGPPLRYDLEFEI